LPDTKPYIVRPDRTGPDVTGSDLAATPERCPVCLAPNGVDARFCEACGRPLRGAPIADGDDDHREFNLGPVAGVCDRGIRHTTNEDAMGLAMVANTLVAVVCDGVSTTPGSDLASRSAAETAVAVIADAVRGQGQGRSTRPPQRRNGYTSSDEVLDILEPPPPPRHGSSWRGELDEPTTAPRPAPGGFEPGQAEKAIHAAVAAAQATIMEVCGGTGRPVPSCTLAAAVITADDDGTTTLTAGWIGDSRIYLLGPRWCERVSDDDTWAAEAARAGIIPASEAETHRRAHTLTRWLGGDAGDITPHIRVHRIDPPSTVIVCSDGLWNYSSRPDALAMIVAQAGEGASALGVARHLTSFAVDRGGHDNITVVAARIGNFRETSGNGRNGGRS
jgi:serine/threonine protein phosphatase PrpC